MSERATRRAFYDADVLVVGAGPAGLAAALRARWVKGYHAVPSSVVVFDPGAPGGLLRWGGCVLTGPSWAYTGEVLNAKLMEDIKKLRVPIVRERVTSIAREGSGFRVNLSSGVSWTGRALVLATGFRAVGEEGDHYMEGVRITFKGYDFFPTIVASAARDAKGRGLLIVGHERTSHMAAIFRAHAAAAGPLTFVFENLEDAREIPADLATLGETHRGRLSGVEKVGDEVRAAVIELPNGELQTLPCGAILLDYNAFELRPALEIGGLLPPLDERGFVKVDAWMRTGLEGIFAAGDVTGRYAATLTALGDGVTAAFSAYRHTWVAKFDVEPNLFAYRALDAALSASPQDMPDLPDDAVPVIVGAPEAVAATEVGRAIDDKTSAAELRARFGAEAANATLRSLFERKELAVHRRSLQHG